MMLSAIRKLYDYHYTSYERIWSSVMTLSSEQFTRENGYSLGSVRNHLVHMVTVDSRWLLRMQNQDLPDFLDERDFPDQETLRPEWHAVRDSVLRYIDGLSEAALEEVVELSFPDEVGLLRNRRWEILLHVANHGTDHRAQILAQLHQLGAETFEHDFILHLWDKEQI